MLFRLARRGGRASAVVLFIALPAGMAKAQNCDWGYSTSISFTAGPAGYAEEIRIDLGPGDFPPGYAHTPDGDDVRAVETGTGDPVDFAVTAWDQAAGTATIFIRPPAIAPNATASFDLLFGNTTVASASDAPTVFPTPGVRLRSRSTTADPTDAASALAAFAAASDVSDAVHASISGFTNRSLGGAGGNFGWCVSAMLEVTAATAGLWQFRYGADFGRGGHLHVSGVPLEEQWNTDLWWNLTYANTSQTLEGSITLTPGWHRFEALGFEGCCDGAVGFQARGPTGPWRDLSSANFALRGAQCIAPEVSITSTSSFSCTSDLRAGKSVAIVDDGLGSPSPFATPGSRVRYAISLENRGIAVDDGSIVLTDVLPSEVSLIVSGAGAFQLVDGSIPSALSLDWGGPADTGDGVSFSTDGSDFSYEPVPDGRGSDPLITHVRFALDGRMAGAVESDYPTAAIVYDAFVN